MQSNIEIKMDQDAVHQALMDEQKSLARLKQLKQNQQVMNNFPQEQNYLQQIQQNNKNYPVQQIRPDIVYVSPSHYPPQNNIVYVQPHNQVNFALQIPSYHYIPPQNQTMQKQYFVSNNVLQKKNQINNNEQRYSSQFIQQPLYRNDKSKINNNEQIYSIYIQKDNNGTEKVITYPSGAYPESTTEVRIYMNGHCTVLRPQEYDHDKVTLTKLLQRIQQNQYSNKNSKQQSPTQQNFYPSNARAVQKNKTHEAQERYQSHEPLRYQEKQSYQNLTFPDMPSQKFKNHNDFPKKNQQLIHNRSYMNLPELEEEECSIPVNKIMERYTNKKQRGPGHITTLVGKKEIRHKKKIFDLFDVFTDVKLQIQPITELNPHFKKSKFDSHDQSWMQTHFHPQQVRGDISQQEEINDLHLLARWQRKLLTEENNPSKNHERSKF